MISKQEVFMAKSKLDIIKEQESTDYKIMQEFNDFAKDSADYFHDIIEAYRTDREFASGNQWDEKDSKNRGKTRAKVTYNLTDNYINAITNPYEKSPYSIRINPKSKEQSSLAKLLNQKVSYILKESKSNSIESSCLKDTVTNGFSWYYASTVKDDIEDQNKTNIKVLSLIDPTLVIPDPYSKEIDSSDQEQLAYLEYLSETKAKSLYGDDILTGDLKSSKYVPMIYNIGKTWLVPDKSLCLVTYFRRKRTKTPEGINKISVEFFKMIGDKIVERGELDTPYIPFTSTKGTKIYRNKKIQYKGIIDKIAPAQKNINYTVSQKRERLARAPKPLLVVTKDSINGVESDYEDIDKDLSPIIRWNEFTDSGKDAPQRNTAPNRISNAVDISDLESSLKTDVEMMSLIAGIPQTGLSGAVGGQEPAESVLLRTKSSESNISHYYDHLRDSVIHMARIILYYIKIVDGLEFNVNDFNIEAVEGPDLITSKIEKKKEVLSYMGVLTEAQKAAVAPILGKMLDVDENEEIFKATTMALPPELKPVDNNEDPEAVQIMTQYQEQVDALTQQNGELNQLVLQLQNQIIYNENIAAMKIQSEQVINESKNSNNLEVAMLKEEAQNERTRAKILADQQEQERKSKLELAKIISKEQELLIPDEVVDINVQRGLSKI